MKKVIDKVIKYLEKQGHDNLISVYLDGYNGNDILIRFDYVKDISAFKILWIDLNYLDVKKYNQYINMQIVTKFLVGRLLEIIENIRIKEGSYLNDDILGDRVSVIINKNKKAYTYTFDRFLPDEWYPLADILVILFSYLPRSMDCFLNEMFGKLDGLEESFNSKKPVKVNINDEESLKKYFKPVIINRGKKYFEQGKVLFLDKIENRYIAFIEGTKPYVVIVDIIDDNYVFFWCNCEYNGFCKHTYAVIEAIKHNFVRKFYKVRRVNEKTLLENLSNAQYELSIGVSDKNILLLTNDGKIISEPLMKNNKLRFEVIEDDDEMSLSNYINELKGE